MSLSILLPRMASSYPFELTEGEREELAGFDREISRIQGEIDKVQQQKVAKLRELTVQKRVAAPKLEDLKSECGKPFVEEKEEGIYRKAGVAGETKPFFRELAYFCTSEFELRLRYSGRDSCGWVKGEPLEKRYNELGPLCGSAGIRFYCRICGKMLGELQQRVS